MQMQVGTVVFSVASLFPMLFYSFFLLDVKRETKHGSEILLQLQKIK